MIITLSSVRGAPGVTSWALLLAYAWPADYGVERVVLEVSTSGGVLGARYGLGVEPGAASLVAAARRRRAAEPVELDEVGRLVADGVWVVPQTESAERANALWSTGSSAMDVARAAQEDNRVWLVDAGRAEPHAPTRSFVATAAMSLVWTGAAREDLVQIPSRVASHQQLGASVGVVVSGRPGHDLDELRSFFGTGLVWVVEASTDLRAIAGAVATRRRARATIVWRQAVELAAELAALVTGPPPDPTPPEPQEARRAASGSEVAL